tara:strand:- start:1211 stop:2785 length:1575 start_codon:yes stop_codon:yes gene_type:complete
VSTDNHSPVAILSVTDKTGIVDFASNLASLGFKILSTGGTAKALKTAGIEVTDVASFANSPEILDGRVKTLHPKIHGGILLDRNNPNHLSQAKAHDIIPIDLVVVNLYQFEKNAMAGELPLNKAIEFIDIGGPTMLRAAAKNYQHAMPVIDPEDYTTVIEELQQGPLSNETRRQLAGKTFQIISQYDQMIANAYAPESSEDLHEFKTLKMKKVQDLRYGENPHQKASFYEIEGDQKTGLQAAKVIQGKPLSYNNLIDLDAATSLVADFSEATAVAIIKHTNPCGIAMEYEGSVRNVFQKALACDPKSAFGGIIATNETIDADAAESMSSMFIECIAAPSFSDEALGIFSKKKNLRLLETAFLDRNSLPNKSFSYRSIRGGILAQQTDNLKTRPELFESKTKRQPSNRELEDLAFAMTVCKHVKSNAIVYAKDLCTVAVGAGQMSRIDSAEFSAEKAKRDGKSLDGAVMASDAFFPFRDTVDMASNLGVKAIIQPGGSIRDEESIQACDDHGIAMVFTGYRHFKH